MSIMTRKERERLVLELYNQGKTVREIAKEARMSFRGIGVILNKMVEEKDKTILILRRTKIENNNSYLYPPKPTNSFLIERLH